MPPEPESSSTTLNSSTMASIGSQPSAPIEANR
jgi:hypothetical protein